MSGAPAVLATLTINVAVAERSAWAGRSTRGSSSPT